MSQTESTQFGSTLQLGWVGQDGLGHVHGHKQGWIGLGGQELASEQTSTKRAGGVHHRKMPTTMSQGLSLVGIDGERQGELDGGGARQTLVIDWLKNGLKVAKILLSMMESLVTMMSTTKVRLSSNKRHRRGETIWVVSLIAGSSSAQQKSSKGSDGVENWQTKCYRWRQMRWHQCQCQVWAIVSREVARVVVVCGWRLTDSGPKWRCHEVQEAPKQREKIPGNWMAKLGLMRPNLILPVV